MAATPPHDPPPRKDPVPHTLSDMDLRHSTYQPDPTATGSMFLSVGSRPLPEYELVRLLGRGGFGEVWQARGPGGFDVALKCVRLGEKVGAIELRALELMKGIRHAHLLPIFGAWQLEGYLLIAMELGDGTLMDRLRLAQDQGETGIPRRELLEYMREAAKGLDFLNEERHALSGGGVGGIQHKDVKPQNLLLVGGTVKVADFGLARVLEQTVTTASGSMTPAYAPPEFFSGQATRWSDQYSLAVTYCQLRGGRLPFAGNLAQVMAGHLTHGPELDMLPPEERWVVARALAKEPEARWPSCLGFVEGLQAPASKGPGSIPAPTPSPAPAPAVRRRGLLLGAVAAVVGVVLGVVWLAGGFSPRTEPSDPKVPASRGSLKKEPVVIEAGSVEGGPVVVEALTSDGIFEPVQRKNDREPRSGKPFTNSVGMKFEWIKPGTFLMGSPDGTRPPGVPEEEERYLDEAPHRVTLTKGFHLGAHLVTQYQWEQVMGKDANHSRFLGKNEEEKKRLPVDSVFWQECQEFCRRLGAREGRRYRLPTEAEWEYACRAGTTTAFWWGNSITPEQANYDCTLTYGKGGKKGVDQGKTTPVDRYPPNPWGLYDMHGNLWQWCEDAYGKYGEGDRIGDKMDPLTRGDADSAHVLRGGAYCIKPARCRAARRDGRAPATRIGYVGCRVVLSLD